MEPLPLLVQIILIGALIAYLAVIIGGLVGGTIARRRGYRVLALTLYIIALIPVLFVAFVLYKNPPRYVAPSCGEIAATIIVIPAKEGIYSQPALHLRSPDSRFRGNDRN
jgi:uncharacterized membrane protein YoaK (UPF0700 family)